jgi:hypothetical protein
MLEHRAPPERCATLTETRQRIYTSGAASQAPSDQIMRYGPIALFAAVLLIAGCAKYPYIDKLPDTHIDGSFLWLSPMDRPTDPSDRWIVVAKSYDNDGTLAICAAALYYGKDETYEKYRSLFRDPNSYFEVGAYVPGNPRVSTGFTRFFRASGPYSNATTIRQIFEPQLQQLEIPCVSTDHAWLPHMVDDPVTIRLYRTTTR